MLWRPLLTGAGSAAVPAVGGAAALAAAYAAGDTLRSGGLTAALLLAIAGVLGCGCFLLPTQALALICGWALGGWGGAVLATAAATAAAPLGYALGGSLAGPGLADWAAHRPRAAAIFHGLQHEPPLRAGGLLALLRLSPVVPFGTINVMSAVFRLPMAPFMIGTAVGMAPRTTIVAFWGAALQRLEDGTARTHPGLLIGGAIATVAALLLVGWMARRALRGFGQSGGERVRLPDAAAPP